MHWFSQRLNLRYNFTTSTSWRHWNYTARYLFTRSRTFTTAPNTYINRTSTFTAVFTKLVVSPSRRRTSCVDRKFMPAWLPSIAHAQCLFAGKAKVADVVQQQWKQGKRTGQRRRLPCSSPCLRSTRTYWRGNFLLL